MTGDVISVYDAAGIEKADVVGLSMGGYTALKLAARFLERLLSCTAVATRARSIEEYARAVRRALSFETSPPLLKSSLCDWGATP